MTYMKRFMVLTRKEAALRRIHKKRNVEIHQASLLH